MKRTAPRKRVILSLYEERSSSSLVASIIPIKKPEGLPSLIKASAFGLLYLIDKKFSVVSEATNGIGCLADSALNELVKDAISPDCLFAYH